MNIAYRGKERTLMFVSFMVPAILLFSFLRLILMVMAFENVSTNPFSLVGCLVVGVLSDVSALCWFSLPLTLSLFLPVRFLSGSAGKALLNILLTGMFALLLFDFTSEILFWDEFSSRFNFIAVDYLIYSKELYGLAVESYPVTAIGLSIGLAVGITAYLLRRFLGDILDTVSEDERMSSVVVMVVTGVVLLTAILPAIQQSVSAGNRYNYELSRNGIQSFVRAFFDNRLDFATFYSTVPEDEAFLTVRKDLKISEEPKHDTLRIVNASKAEGEKKLNVILLMVESLSAEFMGVMGHKGGLTPELDNLCAKSLFFSNCYATGTRTCRGLEALALSLPPTPGRSIVKRPDNENMFSSAVPFKKRGYESMFLYAGYGYFDNMNYFMSHNGFGIIDRADFSKEDVSFSNVWGVCDQDLFGKVRKTATEKWKQGKHFFFHVLTTSNHRPYTYPEGNIDIPSGTGRAGAVKYTDFSIGEFISSCESQEWFRDTVFVIVADHCAGSAGKSEISVSKYHIPLIIYSPENVPPQVNNSICSQMDVIPTILDILNWKYESRFFGTSLVNPTYPETARAFPGNYQYLGYLKDDNLTVLGPNRKNTSYRVNGDGTQCELPCEKGNLQKAVSWYEAASWMCEKGVYSDDTSIQ